VSSVKHPLGPVFCHWWKDPGYVAGRGCIPRMGGVVDNVGMMHRISASLFLPRISNGRVIGKLTKAGRGVRRLAIMCVALFATSTLIMPRTPGRLGFDISCLGGGPNNFGDFKTSWRALRGSRRARALPSQFIPLTRLRRSITTFMEASPSACSISDVVARQVS
jgi:hypothetical protein